MLSFKSSLKDKFSNVNFPIVLFRLLLIWIFSFSKIMCLKNYVSSDTCWICNFCWANIGITDSVQQFSCADSKEETIWCLAKLPVLFGSQIFQQHNCFFTRDIRTDRLQSYYIRGHLHQKFCRNFKILTWSFYLTSLNEFCLAANETVCLCSIISSGFIEPAKTLLT